jgi:hypothetical protein
MPRKDGYPDFEGVCPKVIDAKGHEKLQQDFINRLIPAVVIIGSAGGMKSFNWREADGLYTNGCIYIAGEMRPFGAFCKIRDAVNLADANGQEHPPLIFDDVGNILSDKTKIALLQQAASPRDLKHARKITYTSKAAGEGDEDQTIWFNGPVLILGNNLPKNITETQFSIFDRMAQYSYNPTQQEIHAFLKGRWKRDKEVYGFVGNNVDIVRKPSGRWYDKIANEKVVNPFGWRQQAVEWLIGYVDAEEATSRSKLVEQGKLQIMATLWRNKGKRTANDLIPDYERLCREKGFTGGSTADFKRVKARYLGA